MSKARKAIIKAAAALRAGHPKGGAATQGQMAAAMALDEALDDVEWTEKGLAEWRQTALANARHAEAARATARIAIGHLQRVLQGNYARIPQEQRQQQRQDAEDWLTSIGSEPN